jgi:protein-ribulosamine 3-kinase
MWRREIIKFGQPYFSQYLRHFRPSEPVEQWDDRIRLYSIKFNLAHMIGWPGAPVVRGQYVLYFFDGTVYGAYSSQNI